MLLIPNFIYTIIFNISNPRCNARLNFQPIKFDENENYFLHFLAFLQ